MKWLWPLFLALLMAGCAAPPPAIVSDEAALESGALSRTGRFALRVDEFNGKQHAVQGGFAWFDAGGQLLLDLNSPVGAAIARVEVGADGQSVLTEANGRRTQADSPDQLVKQVLGSTIPVRELRSWLRGRLPAEPTALVTEHDAQGRPTAYQQAGWRVRVEAYDALGPIRLQAQRREPGQGDIVLRLVMTPTGS